MGECLSKKEDNNDRNQTDRPKNKRKHENLTDQQKVMILTNWGIVQRKGLQECGVIMFIRLFTAYPEAVFPFAKDKTVEELEKDDQLGQYAVDVFGTVDKAVGHLDTLQDLTPIFVALGARLQGYGMQPDHFGLMDEIFLATIADVCGNTLIAEESEAFIAFFSIIRTAMMQGYKSK